MAKPRFGKKGVRRTKKPKGPIGKVSRSQTVTTFGPGSLYELRTFKGGAIANSVIIAGTHLWPEDEMQTISEPTLAASLGVDRFLMPPSAEDDDNSVPIPAYRFPEWLECNQCHRVGHADIHFDEEIDAPPSCSANDCNGYGVPTRLVVACYAGENGNSSYSPGHLDNFPWVWWAHSSPGAKICDSPEIYLRNDGKKAGIAGLIVTCEGEGCKESRSLGEAFNPNALANRTCTGYRPWLGSRKDDGVSESCERPIRALLRGASNIYFPVPASAISIPPLSSKLVQEIEVRGQMLLTSLKKRQQNGETFDKDRYITDFQNGIPGFRRYDRDQIGNAIDILLENARTGGQRLTEAQQKVRERHALVTEFERDEDSELEDDFENEVLEKDDLYQTILLKHCLDSLSKVHRLREVRAIRGFQRVESSPVADSYTQSCAPISRYRQDWLPAIETRGEGIYFEVSRNRLSQWEAKEAVSIHIKPLVSNFLRYCEERGLEPNMDLVSSGYLMIHTLSHLLIKQLSLECGYSSASIRERLYYQNDGEDHWVGVLLYTANASADGTLGGLVRQGEPENLDRLMVSALENARWCSSDPLCIESQGQGVDALNLAACHACSLVSETSCEQRNLLLDRALLVGTPETPEIGFFNEWLNGVSC